MQTRANSPDSSVLRCRALNGVQWCPAGSRRIVATMVALALIAACPLVIAAGNGVSPASYTGTWVYSGEKSEETLRLKVIAQATEDMPSFIRRIAQRKLLQKTSAPKHISLDVTDETFVLTRDGKTITLPLDGKSILVRRKEQRGTAFAYFDGASIVVSGKGDRGGTRSTTLTLTVDEKRLVVSTRIVSAKLSAPIVFQHTYARK